MNILAAIIAITTLSIIALLMRVDGILLATAFSLIAGLAGFTLGKKRPHS